MTNKLSDELVKYKVDARHMTDNSEDAKYRFLKIFMRVFGFILFFFGLCFMAAFGIKMIPFAVFGLLIMLVKVEG